MKGRLKSNKAITLVALVVTIVVLLILAGVSINLVVGQNGIINKAKDAKREMEKAKLEEKLKMEMADIEIDSILENNSNNMPKLFDKIKGIERIEVNNNSAKMTIIIEDNNKCYRAIMEQSEDIDIKILEQVQEVGKNTIVLKKLAFNDMSDIKIIEESKNSIICEYLEEQYEIVIEENFKTETGIIYCEKFIPIPIEIVVNSGEDGIVVLPIIETCKVDWGDGTNTNHTESAGNEKGIAHTYTKTNTNYTVKINGKITNIISWACYTEDSTGKKDYEDRIVEISQWGNTGLENIDLWRLYKFKKDS